MVLERLGKVYVHSVGAHSLDVIGAVFVAKREQSDGRAYANSVQKYRLVVKLFNEQTAPALHIGILAVAQTAENSVGISVRAVVNHKHVIACPAVRLGKVVGVFERLHSACDYNSRFLAAEVKILAHKAVSSAFYLDLAHIIRVELSPLKTFVVHSCVLVVIFGEQNVPSPFLF